MPLLNHDSEATLLKKIRTGDPASENELLCRYYGRIVMMAKGRLFARQSDWEDVTQEILVALIDSLRKGNFDPGRQTGLYAFIAGVARNVINKHLQRYYRDRERGHRRVSWDELPAGLMPRIQDEFKLEEKALESLLREELRKLPERLQNVLVLRVDEELSYKEISKKLNIPLGTVKTYLHDARSRLESAVKKMEKL